MSSQSTQSWWLARLPWLPALPTAPGTSQGTGNPRAPFLLAAQGALGTWTFSILRPWYHPTLTSDQKAFPFCLSVGQCFPNRAWGVGGGKFYNCLNEQQRWELPVLQHFVPSAVIDSVPRGQVLPSWEAVTFIIVPTVSRKTWAQGK